MDYPYEEKKYLSIYEEAATIIEETGWIAHNKLEQFLKNYGLTPQQLNVLGILAEGKGSLPTLEIMRRMFQKLPDITRLVDRLETSKLIERERLTSDRRIVMVHLTPEGWDLIAKVFEPLNEFTKEQLGHMTEDELKILVCLLRKARRY